jgi:hypothetical protein
MKTVVVLLALLGTAGAQELDKKQAGLVKRLSPQIVGDTEALSKIGNESWQFTKRVADDYQRRVTRYEGQLKDLPPDHPDVKKVLGELETLRSALAQRTGALTAKTEANAETVKQLTALFTAPEAEEDVKAVQALAAQFQSHGMFTWDSYVFARWPDHPLVLQLRDWAGSWAATEKRLADFRAKYGEGAEFKGKLEGAAQSRQVTMAIALRDAEDRAKKYKEVLETFAKTAPDQIEKEGALLKAETAKAVASNNYIPFLQTEGLIERYRYRLTNIAAIWAPLASSDAERDKVKARAAAFLEESDQAAQKLADLIIKENKGPKDKYTGADRATLETHVKKEWAQKYPKDKVLAVRFDGSAFERHTAWKYDQAQHAFVKEDSSSLGVWVVIEDGPKQAIKHYCTLRKLHLKGNMLDLGFPYRSPKTPPMYRLLTANL